MLNDILPSPKAFLAVSLVLAVVLLCVALGEILYPGIVPKPVNDVVSRFLDLYLRHRFPIKSINGDGEIPTCPYVWPNGQGDVAKFLNGIENSAIWEKSHGPVYRIWSGMSPEVVLTRPGQLKAVFSDSDKHSKAVNNDSGYLMSQLLGKCVGLISPPSWSKVRAVTERPFRHDSVLLRTQDVQRHVETHFAHLYETSDLSRGLLHPAQDMKMLPFWIVCEMFYGPLPKEYLARIGDLTAPREQLMKYVVRGGLSRFFWSQWLPTEANLALQDFRVKWRQLNRDIVNFCQQHNPSSPILEMWRSVRGGDISQDQWLQTLDEALFANLDVTTGGLSWNLVYLAAYPGVQDKLRAEVEAATSSDNLAEYLQRQTTLLQSCILESSRLKPLAAFSVPQSAPTDRIVEGFVVPANTNFVVDSYSLNINNEYWGPDNYSYHPERFMKRNNTELRYLFWRFGFGPRQCMGKYAADLIIRATLCYLMQNFKLSTLGSQDEWARDKESWITHPDFQIACTRK